MEQSHWIKYTFTILTVLGGVAMLLNWERLSRWDATRSSDRVSVWLLTGDLAPGDTAKMKVRVYGGKKISIRGVDVLFRGYRYRMSGEGTGWETLAKVKPPESGRDSVDIAFRIPNDAERGRPSTISVILDYKMTLRSYSEGFQDDIRFSTDISGGFVRALLRGLRALWAIGLFFFIFWLLHWKIEEIRERIDPQDHPFRLTPDNAVLGVGVLMCVICFGFFGYHAFARPIMAATGWIADFWVGFLILLWIAGPPGLAYLVNQKRLRAERYRISSVEWSGPRFRAVTIDDMERVLRSSERIKGLTIYRWRRALDLVNPEGKWVRLRCTSPRNVNPDNLFISSKYTYLVLECCHALVSLLGPQKLRTQGLSLVIDGTKPPDQLMSEYMDRFHGKIRMLMDEMDGNTTEE